MKQTILYILFLFLLTSRSFSQKFIEPVLGLVSNTKVSDGIEVNLKQITVALQICNTHKKTYENGFKLDVGLPIAFKSNDISFTLNPALPLNKTAIKSVKKTSISLTFFQNFKLFSITKKDKFSFLLNSGVSFHKISVSYDYDKINYVVLNPDKTFQQSGVYLGTGFQYLYALKQGRIFLQSVLNFPLITKKNNYPTSYKGLFSPTINVGYSITLNKK